MFPRRRSDETVPAFTTKRSSSRQTYGTCLWPGEHEADTRPLKALDRVAGVVDDVPLAPRAGHGQQVVVEDEDLEVGRLLGELLLDPAVATAADLAVVEVGLARVDGDDRDAALPEHRVPLAEHLLEVDVADVPRVVVPGHDDDRVAVDAVEVLARGEVLVAEAERRQVARADDDVRLELVDLADRALEQADLEVRPAAVEIGDLRDPEDAVRPRHVHSLRGRGRPTLSVPWLCVRVESPVFQAYCGSRPPRFANRSELECAKILDYYGIPWDYEPRTFVLERDDDGRVVSAFTPDFYLPEQDLFIEVTVMKQSLVTRKNRKLREVQRLYPGRAGQALLPAGHREPRAALPAAHGLVADGRRAEQRAPSTATSATST